LTLLKRNTADGLRIVGDLLRGRPKRTLIVFSGVGPNGRTFKVAVELVVRSDAKGRPPVKARIHSKLTDEQAVRLYDVVPLDTRSLDAALTRLPDARMAAMRKKVVIVGCGALGSGIAMMLAKAGVARLVLIDPEVLGWENIRRHELGAVSVGVPKSQALKRRISRSLPEIEEVVAIETSVQRALEKDPRLLDDADLVISATGDWGSDVFLSRTASSRTPHLPVIYTWTEAYALATHAVLLSGEKGHFTDGFDAVGSFMGKASRAGRKPPPECGNTTSPFGAVEVAQSQAMAAKLALEFLGGRHQEADVWWTRTAEETTLEDADGSWTEYWIERRGWPPSLGGVTEGAWKF
jgi:molybdopterin/thiamine biosynthesis adenylyltransferase